MGQLRLCDLAKWGPLESSGGFGVLHGNLPMLSLPPEFTVLFFVRDVCEALS